MTTAPVGSPTLYASVGSELSWYRVDVESATLTKGGAIRLPGDVSYAWPHPSRRYLYVAAGGPSDRADAGQIVALRIEAGSGALALHGAPVPLRTRATHLCVDGSGEYLYTAHTRPSAVAAHRIEPDGTLGGEVPQPDDLDVGIFAHQVRVTPSGQSVILVTRGYDPTDTRPEAPGALKVMGVANGVLTGRASIAPNGGYGFGVRHLDFHPARPWLYVSVERHNQVLMFDIGAGDAIAPHPRFTKNTLSRPRDPRHAQGTGAIHVHPSGRFVYISNRSAGEGEDNIAAFAIDASTGEPTLIQHADSRSLHVRTFSIDSSGRLLAAASTRAYEVRSGDEVRTVPGGISLFRIGADGRLDFVRKYEVDTGGKAMTWSAMLDPA